MLGPCCVGWPANEVAALNAARIAGKSDEDIRALVGLVICPVKRAGRRGADWWICEKRGENSMNGYLKFGGLIMHHGRNAAIIVIQPIANAEKID